MLGRVRTAGVGPDGGGSLWAVHVSGAELTPAPPLSVPRTLLLSNSENVARHEALLGLKH